MGAASRNWPTKPRSEETPEPGAEPFNARNKRADSHKTAHLTHASH